MKKFLFKTCGTLLLMLSFYNCSSDRNEIEIREENPIASTARVGNRYTAEQFDYIGIEHNRILAKTLEDKIMNNVPNSDFQTFSNNSVYKEIEERSDSNDDKALAKDLILKNLHTQPDFSNLYWTAPQGSISETLKKYLDELHALMLEENADLDYLTNNIEKLEQKAYDDVKMNNTDLGTFYCATRVGTHSLNYWTENIDKWEAVFKIPSVAKGKTPGRRIAEIAVVDVGGAVGGATWAWAANVFPGIGQVTYAGAIIGGAVTCSMGALVYHLASSIFQWD